MTATKKFYFEALMHHNYIFRGQLFIGRSRTINFMQRNSKKADRAESVKRSDKSTICYSDFP